MSYISINMIKLFLFSHPPGPRTADKRTEGRTDKVDIALGDVCTKCIEMQ